VRVLSLFSGIGGFEIACEWVGMEIVGQVEIDPFCQKVLAKHWPHVKRMGDIKQVRGDEFGAVDIIIGGVPCQPASVAGKRRGTEDDRWLWPETLRIVKAVRPRWCVFENPTGILSLQGGVPFDNILSEMEREGYEVGAFSIPACAVGAPHRRERIFIVGYSGKCRLSGKPRRGTGEKLEDRYSQLEKGFMADTKNPDRWRTDGEENKRRRNQEVGRCNIARSGVEYGTTQPRMGRVSYGFSAGMDRHSWPAGQWPTPTICGNYNRKGASKTSGDGLHTAVMQWPAGPGEQHEWEPPRIAKGVKNRVARLKALGNAVVPAQVYPILRAIAEIEGMEA